jgi:hypothetical protein
MTAQRPREATIPSTRQKTNRVAWWLAAILAAVVLGGVGVLGVSYQNRLPPQERWLTLLPRSEWGFGAQQQVRIWGSSGSSGWMYGAEILAERRRMGCFAVRVKRPRHPQAPGLPPGVAGYWSAPRPSSALSRYLIR